MRRQELPGPLLCLAKNSDIRSGVPSQEKARVREEAGVKANTSRTATRARITARKASAGSVTAETATSAGSAARTATTVRERRAKADAESMFRVRVCGTLAERLPEVPAKSIAVSKLVVSFHEKDCDMVKSMRLFHRARCRPTTFESPKQLRSVKGRVEGAEERVLPIRTEPWSMIVDSVSSNWKAHRAAEMQNTASTERQRI